MRVLVVRLAAGLILFFAPDSLRAASVRVSPRTASRTVIAPVPVIIPQLIRPVLTSGKSLSWSSLPTVVAPRVLPLLISPALPETPVPAVLPSARTEALSDSVRSAAPNVRDSAERVSEISAKVFDGRTEAPAVSAQAAVKILSPAADQPPALGPRVLKRAVRLIITGPPGSGKGTYSKRLSEHYGIPHISVGELLRAYARTHPDVAARMASGRLVDTELVLRVVSERLRQDDVVERGFILDGFPRRVVEAQALKSILGSESIDAIISLNVPRPELLRRILGRGRLDDTREVFSERMRIYREDTLPAMKLFRKNKPVIAPDVASPDVDGNYSRLKAQFGFWAEDAGLN